MFFSLFIVFVIALIEIRMIQYLHIIHYDFQRLMAITENVLKGSPPLRAQQNRLLGPYIVYFLRQWGGLSLRDACLAVIYGSIFFTEFLVFFLFLYLSKKYRLALKYTALLALLFIVFQHYTYVSLFDFLEVPIFLLFAFGMWGEKHWWYFVPIFFLGLFNRESAIFIALWLMIRALHFQRSFPLFYVERKKEFTLGAILVILGTLYTKLIRDALFKTPMTKSIGRDVKDSVLGNQLHLWGNIKDLFFYNLLSSDILVTFFVVGLFIFLVYITVKYYSNTLFQKSLFIGIVMLFNLVFGIVDETRIYFTVLPLLLFFYWEISGLKQIHESEML